MKFEIPFSTIDDAGKAKSVGIPAQIRLDPDNVRKGLGQLVLTVVELVRQLLEKQAIRRVEAGSLTDEEIERIGQTFLELNKQLTWLKEEFGLTQEVLNLDLGPLGKLL